MRYDAFMSYSHRADSALAAALQRGLHRLGCPWYRLRAMHVFRDKTSLAAAPALWPAIEQALAASSHLLVLASPASAASGWVRREVGWWTEHRPPERLLLVVTGGQIEWDAAGADFDWTRTDCLPPELKGHFASEPLWVDLRAVASRESAMTLRDGHFRAAVLDIAAPLRGLAKDVLDGDDVRQHRRTRRVAGGAIVALALLAVTAAAAAWQAVRQAETARSRELAALSSLQGDVDPDAALLLALAAIRSRPTPSAEAALRAAYGHHYLAHRAQAHLVPVTGLALSADERHLASADYGGDVLLWSTATRTVRHRLPAGGSNGLSFSVDGRWLVTAGASRRVRAWSTETGSLHPVLPPASRDEIFAAVVDADRGLWIATDEDEGLVSWRAADGERRWRRRPGGVATRLELQEDGRHLLIIQPGSGAELMDLERWRPVWTFDPGPEQLVEGAASRDGRSLVLALGPTAGAADHLVVLSLPAGAKRVTMHDPKPVHRSVALDGSGRWLAAGTVGGAVRLYDADDGEHRREYRAHRGPVTAVLVSNSPHYVVSAGEDGQVLWWRRPSADRVWTSPRLGRVDAVAMAEDARTVLVALADGRVRHFQRTVAGEDWLDHELSGHVGGVRCVALSAGGAALVGTDRGLWLWPAGRARAPALRQASDPVAGCAFRGESPVADAEGDINVGGNLVLRTDPSTLDVQPVDPLDARPVGPRIARGGLGRMATSAAAEHAYLCPARGPIRRVDLRTGATDQPVELNGEFCALLASSPDGHFLAVADGRGNIHVHLAATGTRIKTFNADSRFVDAITFGGNAHLLAAIGERAMVFHCDACEPIEALRAMAPRRITRELRADEQRLWSLDAWPGGGPVPGAPR